MYKTQITNVYTKCMSMCAILKYIFMIVDNVYNK